MSMEPCKGEVERPIGLLLPDRPQKKKEPQKETVGGSKENYGRKRKERRGKEGRQGGRKGTVVVVVGERKNADFHSISP